MGMRVHVVKSQVVYGHTEAFNWKFKEFYQFLDIFTDEIVCEDYFSDNYEIPVADYKKALDFVKRYFKADTDKKRSRVCRGIIHEDDFKEAFEAMETTPERLLEAMTAFYKERDKHSNWIQFHAW